MDKEEVGKGGRWICRVFALGKVGFISVVPALVQNMSGEPRNRKPVCGVMASAFCFGGEEQIPACSFFAFSSRRGTGPRVSHGPWCQRGGCPGLGGADWGVSGLHSHLWLRQFSPWGASGFFTASVAPGL